MLRKLSNSPELFENRAEAGRLLARQLETYKPRRPVVLGIPRGGVVVACELAAALDGDMDIDVVRKLGAPGNPELAIGAVAEDGKVFLDKALAAAVGADANYIQQEVALARGEIARRSALYRTAGPKASLAGRVVIVADDGVATGATMQAALWAARLEAPQTVVAAIPVGPPDTLERLAQDADEVICLRVPPFFQAVGQFYDRFEQVSDEEVLELLRGRSRKGAA